MLPSMPLSILYSAFVPFCLLLVSTFTTINDVILLKLSYLIVTTSFLSSSSLVEFYQLTSSFLYFIYRSATWFLHCILSLMHALLKWFFSQLVKVLPYAEHCLGRCDVPQYLQH